MAITDGRCALQLKASRLIKFVVVDELGVLDGSRPHGASRRRLQGRLGVPAVPGLARRVAVGCHGPVQRSALLMAESPVEDLTTLKARRKELKPMLEQEDAINAVLDRKKDHAPRNIVSNVWKRR